MTNRGEDDHTATGKGPAAKALHAPGAGDPDASWTEPPDPRIGPGFGTDRDARTRWMIDIATERQRRGHLVDDAGEVPARHGLPT